MVVCPQIINSSKSNSVVAPLEKDGLIYAEDDFVRD